MSAIRKDKGRNTPARKAAFCGVFAALSMTMLYVGGLTPLDLSILVVCSLITAVVAIETGLKTAWLYAAVTAALTLILLPSKFYAIQYIAFSAVYPLLVPLIDRLPRAAAAVVRIAVLDLMLLACVLLGQLIFMVGDEFFPLGAITFVLGTVFFVLYDLAFTMCLRVYIVKLRKKINFSRFL